MPFTEANAGHKVQPPISQPQKGATTQILHCLVWLSVIGHRSLHEVLVARGFCGARTFLSAARRQPL